MDDADFDVRTQGMQQSGRMMGMVAVLRDVVDWPISTETQGWLLCVVERATFVISHLDHPGHVHHSPSQRPSDSRESVGDVVMIVRRGRGKQSVVGGALADREECSW